MILNAYFQQITSKFIIEIFLKKWDTRTHMALGVEGKTNVEVKIHPNQRIQNILCYLVLGEPGVSSKIRQFLNMPFFNLIEIHVYYKSCPNLIFWFLKF